MIRLLKSIAAGGVISLMTTASLLADGFTFYEFECDALRMSRTRDQLVYERRDPTVDDDIVFSCEGRSCVNKEAWDDGSGNTGIRFRYIYFPRGRMEYIAASVSWRDGEGLPYHHVNYVSSLLPCGF